MERAARFLPAALAADVLNQHALFAFRIAKRAIEASVGDDQTTRLS
jgi:hypothetical protein